MGKYFRNNSRKKSRTKKSRTKNRKNKTRTKFSKQFRKIYKGGGDESITKEELQTIIKNFNFKPDYSESDRKTLDAINNMTPDLLKLKYDPNYLSCFTGEPTRDLYNMISDKLQCFAKYGDNPLDSES